MPGTAGQFYGQSPAKSPAQILAAAGKCEITLAGFGMESKPHSSKAHYVTGPVHKFLMIINQNTKTKVVKRQLVWSM